MRILWLVNIALPEASSILNEKIPDVAGWLVGLSKNLTLHKNIELHIAFPYHKAKSLESFNSDKITYYAFPPFRSNDIERINKDIIFLNLLNLVKPDLVHIHGTEYPHSLAMINVCKAMGIKHIVSIQGLVSVCEKHVYSNLPKEVIYKKPKNSRDLKRISDWRKFFRINSKFEIESLKNTNHVVGRTTWDRACVYQINPKVKYHFCNEILRDEFYRHKWNINNIERFSIFVSQGTYPIKGLHNVIQALRIVLKDFPETKLYVSGSNILEGNNPYGEYIRSLLKRFQLLEKVTFTGYLNEYEMCSRYLKSHLFVSASSIENSPNSLGEAMILGVPCVASYVGGVPDLLSDKEEGFLYQHDAPYMLAHYVCEIFKNDKLAQIFSQNARTHALKTHDPAKNTERMLEIYNYVLNNDE